MTVRLSYEPSVEALLCDVLGAGAELLGDPGGLRNRVTWPVVLRATGLGSLEGGEVVIVPPGREREVLAHLSELSRTGIAALVVASKDQGAAGSAESRVPVLLSPLAGEPRRLKEEIERFIMRRRRELFSLDQRLHRTLVDAALGGASMERLVDIGGSTGAGVMVEAGTELWTSDDAARDSFGPSLRAIELAVQDGQMGVVRRASGDIIAAPLLVAGRRRGAAAVSVAEPCHIDDAEVLAVTLAAASAFVLARTPDAEIQPLDAVLREAEAQGGRTWWCAVMSTDDPEVERLARAAMADASARGMDALLGVEDRTLYSFLPSAPGQGWPREVARRAGLVGLRAGMSGQAGTPIARQAAQEASDAYRLGRGDVTAYEEVEVVALLGRVPGWEAFVNRKLGPLLGSPDLLASLDAYFRDRNVTRAATRLSVHRNTLIYRLKRCRELLGVDLDDPAVSFSLSLALQMREAHGGGEGE